MKQVLSIYFFIITLLLTKSSIQEIDRTDESDDQFDIKILKAPSLQSVPIESELNPTSIESPESEEELNTLMQNNRHYHALYSESFLNNIEKTSGIQISLDHFSEIHCCDNKTVYVGAAVSYKQLISKLKEHKFALNNVPNSIHENVVESIINSSFSANFYSGLLANIVTEIVILKPNGVKRYYTPRDIEFTSITLGFGFAGIVIGVSLKVVPEFHVRKCIYQNMLHYDFTRKLHLLFYGRNYSWFFLDLKTMKWEVHQIFNDDSIHKPQGKFFLMN
jgi:hypothetical protein